MREGGRRGLHDSLAALTPVEWLVKRALARVLHGANAREPPLITARFDVPRRGRCRRHV